MELTNENFSQPFSSYQLPYMDQLTEELIAEGDGVVIIIIQYISSRTESRILQQYMDDMTFTEQAVTAAVDSSEAVVCPICQQLVWLPW